MEDLNPHSKNGRSDGPDWASLPGETPGVPFTAAWPDRLFALVFYALGYFYIRYAFSSSGRWPAGVFTIVYAAVILGYFLLKHVRLSRFSWFWLGALLALGTSFILFDNQSLLGFDVLILHGLALYWPLCAAGCVLKGGTSSLLPFDLVNAVFILPFGNWAAQVRCLFCGWRREKSVGWGKRILTVLLGIVLLFVLLVLVVPLLYRADAAFERVLSFLIELMGRFRWRPDLFLLLAVPVGAYLFGLVFGCANQRHTGHIRTDGLAEAGKDARLIPNAALYIAMGGVYVVYALFVILQFQELCSAFAGRLSGTEQYSAFAREGFFELCRVASINGFILLGADLLAVRERSESRLLRWFHVVLAVLTLFILASAARKMLLYIHVFGLTAKRVLTLAFMAMLAVLFGGIIVWQKRDFPFVRVAVVFAVVLFCLLALCDLDARILAFNAAHGF